MVHAHEDYPDRDDVNWQKRTLVSVDEKGRCSFDYRPVHMYTLTDDVSGATEAARVIRPRLPYQRPRAQAA